MGDFLSTLVGYIGKLWPLEKVAPWMRGIRITYHPPIAWDRAIRFTWPFFFHVEDHAPVESIGPGLHWRCPWFQEIHVESILVKSEEFPIQSITTKDKRSMTLGVCISYVIEDAPLNLTSVNDFTASMHNTSRSHLAKKLRDLTWDEFLGDMSKNEKSLEGRLTTQLKQWGVRVVDVGFTDFVETPVYRLFGTSTQWPAGMFT